MISEVLMLPLVTDPADGCLTRGVTAAAEAIAAAAAVAEVGAAIVRAPRDMSRPQGQEVPG